MIFIESTAFTQDLPGLLSDDSYAEFQAFLVSNPRAGDVIQGAGGLRKIRWKTEGRGKSGGVRVIYFHRVTQSQIRLLVIYRKGIKDNVTEAEKKVLRRLNENW